MTKAKITAVVLTKNEEERLPKCLASLSWVDQILVIDDFSSDETIKVAKDFGAEVYQKRLVDFQSQRNYALKKVKTPWGLFIDADEEVPDELRKEIALAIKKKGLAGFYFPRRNIIFGKWIEHSGWYPDYQLHLFRTDKGKYVGKVHETVEVKGKTGYLKSHLLHQNYQTISQYLEKLGHYTTLSAKKVIESGHEFKPQDLIKKPAEEFFKRFFAEEGYEDGLHGLALALLQAFSELILYLKVWEKQGFKEVKKERFLEKVEKELVKIGKELRYWFLTSRIREESNFLKRAALKIKRRLGRIL